MTKFLRENLIVIILIAVIGLVAFSSSMEKKNRPVPITIAVAQQPEIALAFIADSKGYFKEEGLNVTFKRFALGRDAIDNVIAGEAHLATVFAGPFVKRVYDGKEIQAISRLHVSTENSKVVARRDSGVEKPADLVGKRIGVLRDTNLEYFLYSFLLGNGITESEVTVVGVEVENLEQSLISGEVDAVTMYGIPLRETMKKYPETLIAFKGDVYREASVLAGNKEFIESHPEQLTKAVKALIKAQQYFKSNPEESAEIVRMQLGESFTLETVKEAFAISTISLGLNHILLSSMDQEARWLITQDLESGKEKKELPNFHNYVSDTTLKRLQPHLVTIF